METASTACTGRLETTKDDVEGDWIGFLFATGVFAAGAVAFAVGVFALVITLYEGFTSGEGGGDLICAI